MIDVQIILLGEPNLPETLGEAVGMTMITMMITMMTGVAKAASVPGGETTPQALALGVLHGASAANQWVNKP